MNKRIDLTFIIILFIATFFSFIFHEFGHWIIGEILGNKMMMTLNGSWPASGKYINEWNLIYVFLGGPLFTLLQAMSSLFLIMKFKKKYIYPFLFIPFLMRLLIFFGPFKIEDEAIISSNLGIGIFTFPLIIITILTILIVNGSALLKLDFKFNSYCAVFSAVFIIFLININRIVF